MSAEECGGFDADFDKQLEEVQAYLSKGTARYRITSRGALRTAAEVVAEARKRLKAVMLPGWKCTACGYFNGDAKERLSACRGCGLAVRR